MTNCQSSSRRQVPPARQGVEVGVAHRQERLGPASGRVQGRPQPAQLGQPDLGLGARGRRPGHRLGGEGRIQAQGDGPAVAVPPRQEGRQLDEELGSMTGPFPGRGPGTGQPGRPRHLPTAPRHLHPIHHRIRPARRQIGQRLRQQTAGQPLVPQPSPPQQPVEGARIRV
ncbi:MAG: hypothetical protein ACREQ5_25975, partial [Candidatus Dormibacteria bacterium]